MNESVRGTSESTRLWTVAAGVPAARILLGRTAIVIVCMALLSGCGAIKWGTLKTALNLGKFKGIERTAPDEAYYLVKDIYFTGGSAYNRRDDFDHTLQPHVSLVFQPANEKGHYVTKSIWYDPAGEEFRTMRQTHDKQEEQKRGEVRNDKGGTTRMHTVNTQELFERGPGRWKVELYIDDKLARRVEMSVR